MCVRKRDKMMRVVKGRKCGEEMEVALVAEKRDGVEKREQQ